MNKQRIQLIIADLRTCEARLVMERDADQKWLNGQPASWQTSLVGQQYQAQLNELNEVVLALSGYIAMLEAAVL
jgi:hypothetical protein